MAAELGRYSATGTHSHRPSKSMPPGWYALPSPRRTSACSRPSAPTTTAAPLSWASSSSSSRASLPGASSPTNGSSTSRTWYGRTSPMAIEVFWRRPRLNRAGRSSARWISPMRSRMSSNSSRSASNFEAPAALRNTSRRSRAGRDLRGTGRALLVLVLVPLVPPGGLGGQGLVERGLPRRVQVVALAHPPGDDAEDADGGHRHVQRGEGGLVAVVGCGPGRQDRQRAPDGQRQRPDAAEDDPHAGHLGRRQAPAALVGHVGREAQHADQRAPHPGQRGRDDTGGGHRHGPQRRLDQRSAASTEMSPTRNRPSPSTASDTATASRPHTLKSSGHRPMRPHRLNGDPSSTLAASATATDTAA